MCSADDDKDASKPKAANKFSSDEDSDEDDDDEEDSREMTGRIYTKAGLEVTILMGLTDFVFWLLSSIGIHLRFLTRRTCP